MPTILFILLIELRVPHVLVQRTFRYNWLKSEATKVADTPLQRTFLPQTSHINNLQLKHRHNLGTGKVRREYQCTNLKIKAADLQSNNRQLCLAKTIKKMGAQRAWSYVLGRWCAKLLAAATSSRCAPSSLGRELHCRCTKCPSVVLRSQRVMYFISFKEAQYGLFAFACPLMR